MEEIRSYVQAWFASENIMVPASRVNLFEQFISEERNYNVIKQMLDNQQMLMNKWQLQNRIMDITGQSVSIPNATVGKPYEAAISFEKLSWTDLSLAEFIGLEEIGLKYDATTRQISGTPTQSGDLKITFRFNIAGEPEETPPHERPITLVINPDPKSLWKNKPSDRDDLFWKEDNVTVSSPLGDKHIIVSSKRGRSHANNGSFRDDDFAFRHFKDTGWSVAAVSDGAGSARFSREGSRLACSTIIDYFGTHLALESFASFDQLVMAHQSGAGEDTQKKLNHFLYHNLGQAALTVYKKLEECAALNHADIKDFHATLIFTLLKKYDSGYAILTFGVGDCPIAVLNKEGTEVTLMNKLDVGEYGGGTRFITMQDIFQSDKFATRFGFRFTDDFSYLFMMTDGIYDPKFVVEANLEKAAQWQAFLADLNGNNEEGIKVSLKPDNAEITQQLDAWMDFWSPGNHDDRTLAIIF